MSVKDWFKKKPNTIEGIFGIDLAQTDYQSYSAYNITPGDYPHHPNCRTTFSMSQYDDLVRRHKKVEDLRKKAAASRTYSGVSSSTASGTGASFTDLDKAMKQWTQLQSPAFISFSPYSTGAPARQIANPGRKKAPAKKVVTPKPPKPTVDFDTVILEPEKKQMVLEALDQLGNHSLIFEKWGFAKTLEKGKAVSMLFYGPPGTGKTLLAQAIADKLGKKLKVIGTAEIESSEPGQAERNLKTFFEQTKSDTILLFDECDSLIYDRQQVGSILAAQVNQLLSSLEKFEGVVVFTTNRLGVLDEAFNRRLSLKLEFELPKFEERLQIWKRMFPKEAPLAKDINWDRLAEAEIAGGHIKNAVLRAARSAASQKLEKGKKRTITQLILEKALAAEIKEMVKFMEAKEQQGTLPHQIGYSLRKTT